MRAKAKRVAIAQIQGSKPCLVSFVVKTPKPIPVKKRLVFRCRHGIMHLVNQSLEGAFGCTAVSFGTLGFDARPLASKTDIARLTRPCERPMRSPIILCRPTGQASFGSVS